MKFRLALLDKDAVYLQKLVAALNTKYPDLEVSSFTDAGYVVQNMSSLRPDVLVAGTDMGVDESCVSDNCCLGYFSEDNSVKTISGVYAVGKYQKVDLIYREFLILYSQRDRGGVSGGEGSEIFVFTSPCGGSGSSTMAAACAAHFAEKGEKVLYLNLEKFGCSDAFFSGAGKYNMSDIIFALKSKKGSLAMKMEGCVRQDACGVYFFSGSKLALDMLELNGEEIAELINELRNSNYKYVVIDMDFGVDKHSLKILKNAKAVVWCTDGSDTNNAKIVRAYEAVSTLEMDEDLRITEKTAILYNKRSTSSKSVSVDVRSIGSVPRMEHANAAAFMKNFSQFDVFEKLLN